MHLQSKTVYDDFIPQGNPSVSGGTPVYTSVEDVEEMGSGRQLAVMGLCTSYALPTTISVTSEHSGDGKTFIEKAQLVVSLALSGASTSFYGSEALGSPGAGTDFTRLLPVPPSQRFVRLKIVVLGNVGGIPNMSTNCHVRLIMCLRGGSVREESRAADTQADVRALGEPGSLARHAAMMSEVRALHAQMPDLPPQHKAAWLARNVSPETREHVVAVNRRLLALPHHVRRDITARVADMGRQALAYAGGPRPVGAQSANCCDGPKAKVPSPAGCGCAKT